MFDSKQNSVAFDAIVELQLFTFIQLQRQSTARFHTRSNSCSHQSESSAWTLSLRYSIMTRSRTSHSSFVERCSRCTRIFSACHKMPHLLLLQENQRNALAQLAKLNEAMQLSCQIIDKSENILSKLMRHSKQYTTQIFLRSNIKAITTDNFFELTKLSNFLFRLVSYISI